MGTEIERKFLIDKEKLVLPDNYKIIRQAYVDTNNITLRIRTVICSEKGTKTAFITIKKGISKVSRLEYEYPIPYEDAENMIATLCNNKVMEKTLLHKE